MSGYPYNNPQYPSQYPPQYPPPPQNQIYPQIYPQAYGAPGAPAYPTAPPAGMNPAAMSYPGAPLPTVSPTPVYPGFPGGQPYQQQPAVEWIPCTDFSAEGLTHRAVVAGYEGHDGSPLWVIRAHHEGDIIPGKLAIKHKSAYIPWGGQEVQTHNFEVCVAEPQRVRWVECGNGSTPPNAIPGGRTASGETLYIGRAKYQGSLTPGKIHPSHKVLYISFGGNEVPHQNYEVLCTI